jgi:hypothetical protein
MIPNEAGVTAPRGLVAQGRRLDTSPDAFGELRSSADVVGNVGELWARLLDDGYLYLPGFLDRDAVLEARHEVLCRMADAGHLAAGSAPDDALPGPQPDRALLSDIAKESASLMSLLYGPRVLNLYAALFGEPARHFDFTWLRAYPPGPGTSPHMDSVFMNRGSARVLSAWVPLGDVDTGLGGLAILEGSHRLRDVIEDYASRDVDTYCSNDANAEAAAATDGLLWNGAYSDDPVALREAFGLRWLTADFTAGDFLTFPLHTMHIGLDNTSGRIRLSTDSRYQPASESADPRWVGPNPSAHGSRSKVGVIC